MGAGALGPMFLAAQIGAFGRRSSAPASSKRCKFCGTGGFHWRQTNEGWRLHDDKGKRHLCQGRSHDAPFIPSYLEDLKFSGPEFEFDE